MHHRLVSMPMSMGRWIRHRRVARRMDVLMMLIVHVRVIMLRHRVSVLVLVTLTEM
jgi:hypothetical protein